MGYRPITQAKPKEDEEAKYRKRPRHGSGGSGAGEDEEIKRKKKNEPTLAERMRLAAEKVRLENEHIHDKHWITEAEINELQRSTFAGVLGGMYVYRGG